MKKTTTQYKGVYVCTFNGKQKRIVMGIMIKSKYYKGIFETLREAAIDVDKRLIENGMPPVNILVKKI